MKILSLNCGSIGIIPNCRRIKELALTTKVDFLPLQETKLSNINQQKVSSVWPSSSSQFLAKDADGLAGGLLCVWNLDILAVSNSFIGSHKIGISSLWKDFSKPFLFINVYAPCSVSLKTLCGMIYRRLLMFGVVLCVMGDFNAVRRNEERKGSLFDPIAAAAFNTFISSLGLCDLKLGGTKYTWYNKAGTKMSKLDRFLISSELLDKVPSLSAFTLDRFFSGRCPIILRDEHKHFGPSPFRIFNCWLKHDGFIDCYKEWWNYAPTYNTDGVQVKDKLKFVKTRLKSWSKEVLGKLKQDRMNAEKSLNQFDILVEGKVLSSSEIFCRVKASELTTLDCIYDDMIRKKSRLKWIQVGDGNTRYFML